MEILTERLRLREFVPEDTGPVWTYRQDPRYLEHYYREAPDRTEVEHFVGTCISWAGEAPRSKVQLAIASRSSGTLLGSCGLRRMDARAKRADIGYELAPERWGRGFATEAVAAMLRFGFESLHLVEIEAHTVASNVRSIGLLEKLDFELRDPEPGSSARVYTLTQDKWRTGTV